MHTPACPGCSVPDGLCHCGCGAVCATAAKTEHRKNRVKGAPHQYVRGHNPRPGSDVLYLTNEAGCWLWQRAIDRHGYGLWHDGPRLRLAHRVMYERETGPIPDGLTLDHLCCVRSCVNPAHLEPVTIGENVRRRRQDTLAPR